MGLQTKNWEIILVNYQPIKSAIIRFAKIFPLNVLIVLFAVDFVLFLIAWPILSDNVLPTFVD